MAHETRLVFGPIKRRLWERRRCKVVIRRRPETLVRQIKIAEVLFLAPIGGESRDTARHSLGRQINWQRRAKWIVPELSGAHLSTPTVVTRKLDPVRRCALASSQVFAGLPDREGAGVVIDMPPPQRDG